jgi:ankyrin repeat protein
MDLFSAIINDDIIFIQKEITRDVDINQQHIHNKNMRPLIFACLAGRIEIIKLLIKHGADINQVDLRGFTPLMVMRQENYNLGGLTDTKRTEIINILIGTGADVTKAPNGMTAEMF